MIEEFQCGICYECQVCIECEKYGGGRMVQLTRQPQKPVRVPQQEGVPQAIQPRPQIQASTLTEEKVREIVLEMLIHYGLIKPQERMREIR